MYRYMVEVYNSNRSQIVFEIEKLISTICEHITIAHISKYTNTCPNKMYTEEFTFVYLKCVYIMFIYYVKHI
jgi:hypothetical protein